ncbi:hypothetical protein [Vibrio sp. SCSIO 43136]|uniref:hypothetical protein n=1 Tax=Vibrio sp. SCSIO 43136 TaxID=2819101 RepID=UPI0020750AD9|nr:hypothetical protein [Vibrio sp. SCSIO 43136]USD64179.1 hypothetical protein J4N39_08625 [Vibrio sp. SCSIO 43136]
MKKLVFAAVAATALISNVHAADKKLSIPVAKIAVTEALDDSKDVRFKDVEHGNKETQVCGKVASKGEFIGFKKFAAIGSGKKVTTVIIATDKSNRDKIARVCD